MCIDERLKELTIAIRLPMSANCHATVTAMTHIFLNIRHVHAQEAAVIVEAGKIMTDTESLVFHQRLLQCLLMKDNATKSLGRLTAAWIDLDTQKVLGFECRDGLWDLEPHTYSLDQIHHIDNELMTLNLDWDTHPNLMWRLQAKNSALVGNYIGLEVWTQKGKCLGNVIDFSYNLESGNIYNYLCSKNSIHISPKPKFQIATNTIVAAGLGWLLVSDPMTSREPEVKEQWYGPTVLSVI